MINAMISMIWKMFKINTKFKYKFEFMNYGNFLLLIYEILKKNNLNNIKSYFISNLERGIHFCLLPPFYYFYRFLYVFYKIVSQTERRTEI